MNKQMALLPNTKNIMESLKKQSIENAKGLKNIGIAFRTLIDYQWTIVRKIKGPLEEVLTVVRRGRVVKETAKETTKETARKIEEMVNPMPDEN